MIYYVCRQAHAYTIGLLCCYFDLPLNDALRILPYERLGLLQPGDGDVVIWTDFDRLTVEEAQMAASVHDRVAQGMAHVVQLNHPIASLGRFRLLQRLYETGINSFQVYRLGDAGPGIRFPVFIRRERGVSRHAPKLLRDWSQLSAAIERLRRDNEDETDLMIVEQLDAPALDSKYRKYGVYRVGDQLYAQHCYISDHWYIKYVQDGWTDAMHDEHYGFIDANPHQDALRPVFEVANIDYGRVDYTVVDGRVQIFEINTNPTVLSQAPSRFDDFDSVPYAKRHQSALLALSSGRPIASDNGSVSPDVGARIDTVHQEMLAQIKVKYDRRRRRSERKKRALALLPWMSRPGNSRA